MNISLEQRIANLSPEKRALLEKRLQERIGTPSQPQQTIQPCDRSQPLPLSFSQQRLWFLHQLQPGLTAYNTTNVYRLEGELNRHALQQSLDELMRRHEILRTTFVTVKGEPRQVVNPPYEFPLHLEELNDLPEAKWQSVIEQKVQSENRRPFDLSGDSTRRATLLQLSADVHVLMITSHHIASDGWSNSIFWQELSTLYADFLANRPASLRPLPIQYGDYAVWQRNRFAEPSHIERRNYWRHQLAGVPDLLPLPTDHQRPAICTFAGASYDLAIGANIVGALRTLCRQTNSTLYMSLLAAFDVLLYRYTGSKDIVVGTPIANRPLPELENLIGFFVNTLPLRAQIEPDISYLALLERVRSMLFDAYSHQETPFEQMVEELSLERSLAYSPLVQVIFVLQNAPAASLSLPGLKIERLHFRSQITKFDLTVTLYEIGDGLRGRIEYNSDLFERSTIQRMADHFDVLLHGVVQNPMLPLDRLPILTSFEQNQMLVEWNTTRRSYPRNLCLHEIFAAQANQTPNAIAATFQGQSLTYRELDQRSNQLAHYLRKQGIVKGDKVGLFIERSLENVIAYLAILKAGAAYVPLPVDYPAERLCFMIHDSGSRLILTLGHLADKLSITQLPSCVIDRDWAQIAKEGPTSFDLLVEPTDHAYVLYTSGSTGQPKGVAITHRNVVRLVQNTNYATFRPEDVILQSSTLAFDASTFEIWAALLNGARLIIVPPGVPSMAELAAIINRYDVTIALLPTGLFHLMVESQLAALLKLRQLLVGGDVLSPKHARTFLSQASGCQLINAYGPTENGVITCCYPLRDASQITTNVPIGRPIANTYVYILDDNRQPVPIGVVGELYTSGDGVADGYLNSPELTRQRFIDNPFRDPAVDPQEFSQTHSGDKLYRTGDLVRYRADGAIDFVGRRDCQVKIRGFRVELGEIELVLNLHPAVKQSLVMTVGKDAGDLRLVAYVVMHTQAIAQEQTISGFVKERLPVYMVPSEIIIVDAFPITNAGKVDRQALLQHCSQTRSDHQTLAARNELEKQLVEIWEAVLGTRPIGIRDNFFDLGGHSLLAVQLFDRIFQLTGQTLPLATLFQTPTIEALAAALRSHEWVPNWNTVVPIRPVGSLPPLFVIPPAASTILRFEPLLKHLDPELPIYGLQHRGLEDGAEPLKTVEEMAMYFVEAICSWQPTGPYLLAGICFGAHIAYEVAQRLLQQGQEVPLLTVIDAGAPANGPQWSPDTKLFRKIHWHVERLRIGYQSGDWGAVRDYYLGAAKRRLNRLNYGKPLHHEIKETHRLAQIRYQAQIYPGRLFLLQSEQNAKRWNITPRWRVLVPNQFENTVIVGSTHTSLLFSQRYLQELSTAWTSTIRRSIDRNSL